MQEKVKIPTFKPVRKIWTAVQRKRQALALVFYKTCKSDFAVGHGKFFNVLRHEKSRKIPECKVCCRKKKRKKDDSILCLTKHVKDIIKYLQMLSHSDCLAGQTSETL